MTRRVVGLMLGLALAVGGAAVAGDESQKSFTPEERKQLESTWQKYSIELAKLFGAGKPAEAAAAGRKALATARRLHPDRDHLLVSRSLNNLAVVINAQGQSTEAEALQREALAMNRRLFAGQDEPNVAGTLNNLANTLWALGKYTAAEGLAQEALAMRRRLHRQQDDNALAYTINTVALILQDQGKYAQAETLHREALAMRRRLFPDKDHGDVAASLNNLAIVLYEQGKIAEADTIHREALALRRRLYRGQDHPDVAQSLNNLATVVRDQAKYAEAEGLHREALAIRQRVYAQGDHPEVAASLDNLGIVLVDQGKHGEAETLHRAALTMRRRLFAKLNHPAVATTLNNLGNVLVEQGKYADADECFREAIALYRRAYRDHDHPVLARALTNLGSVCLYRHRHAEAETHFGAAMAMYRALAREYAALRFEGEALTVAATYAPARDGFLSSAWHSQENAATVYAAVWASKAVLSRVYEQRALAARTAAADPRAAALLAQHTDCRRQRADLLLTPTLSEAVAKERDTALAQLTQEIDTLERALRPLLPALDRADKLAIARPADLQKMLPADTAVVDFLRSSRYLQDPQVAGKKGLHATVRYLAFIITRDKVVWLDLEEAEPIELAITAWRQTITGGKEIPPEVPARVRKLIWTKVRAALPEQVRRVYVCPDVGLCRVPWAALPGDRSNTVLLEDYAIATIPHAVFLLDKLSPAAKPAVRPTSVLAVGGVAYDAALPAADHVAVHPKDPLLKPGQPPAWTVLPGTAAEVRGVSSAAKWKSLDCRTIEQEEATTKAVLTALPQARYAHLATHGFFADPSFRSALQLDSRLFEVTLRGERIGAGALSPMVLTGLVFAGANKPGTPSRGIVTGEALVELDLSGLDLAVLSACETGIGDVAGGEGSFGLQRAFHLAGTRDVIASLWQVPDQSTAALMALFYRNLWETEMPPIEALRQAQLEIYRHPERIAALADDFRGKERVVQGKSETPVQPDGKAHPRLWAAFTLSGPGR